METGSVIYQAEVYFSGVTYAPTAHSGLKTHKVCTFGRVCGCHSNSDVAYDPMF